MDETKSGIGWWGIVIVFILLFAVFGNGNLFGRGGFGGHGYGYDGFVGGMGYGFQNFKATCDAEKAEIINSATTQFKVVDQGSATRDAISIDGQATRALINGQAMQDLRDKYAEALRQNTMLQTQLYSDAKFNALAASIAEIKCNMLRRPDITGIGAVCPNAGILNGLGIDRFNSGCGCGYNGLNA